MARLPFWKRARRSAPDHRSGWDLSESITTDALPSAEATPGHAEVFWEIQPPRVQLQVDEALSVPLTVTEQNATHLLEQTYRMREHREQERSACPPVCDFGSQGYISG